MPAIEAIVGSQSEECASPCHDVLRRAAGSMTGVSGATRWSEHVDRGKRAPRSCASFFFTSRSDAVKVRLQSR